MPVNLTEAEIKGRDDRPPAKRIALSIHIGQGYFKYIVCMKLKVSVPYKLGIVESFSYIL